MPLFFGKKYIPDAGAPRSGILPTQSGRSEIGNKSLLRLIDSVLQLKGVKGTPATLETTDIKGVLDLSPFIFGVPPAPPGRPQIGASNASAVALGGQNDVMFVIAAPTGIASLVQPPTHAESMRILAASTLITYGAAPVDNARLILEWYLGFMQSPNGSDRLLVKISGGDITNPWLLDSDTLQYHAAFLGTNAGGDGSAGNSSGSGGANPRWGGWLLNDTEAGAYDGMTFQLRYRQWDVVGAAPLNFPANTVASVSVGTMFLPTMNVPVNL